MFVVNMFNYNFIFMLIDNIYDLYDHVKSSSILFYPFWLLDWWFHNQVIGPYRSGKSFLLNQLLSLSCYEGIFFIIVGLSVIHTLHCWRTSGSIFPLQVLGLDICVTQRQKVIQLSKFELDGSAILCLQSSAVFLSGIWVWGTPVELDVNGVNTSVFYLDTEGFESIGKSNVYDDR